MLNELYWVYNDARLSLYRQTSFRLIEQRRVKGDKGCNSRSLGAHIGHQTDSNKAFKVLQFIPSNILHSLRVHTSKTITIHI